MLVGPFTSNQLLIKQHTDIKKPTNKLLKLYFSPNSSVAVKWLELVQWVT